MDMKLTNNTLLVVATLIILGFIIVASLQHDLINKYKDIINQIDTTTTVVVKHDTIYKTVTYKDTVPRYITKTIVKKDTVYKDSIPHPLTLETKLYANTITNEGDTTSYEAYVSGYNIDDQDYPRLDSINVNTSHKTINTVETITEVIKVPQKRSKWHLSPSVGIGYGITSKQFEPYIGFGINYNF